MRRFVHLHNHTQYSLLDGACRIPDFVRRAKELGQTAIAVTDHGNMFGAAHFYKAATDAGLKPILGQECYVAPLSRFDKKTSIPGHLDSGHHLTFFLILLIGIL